MFTLWPTGMAKSTLRQVLFSLTIKRSCRLSEFRWFVYISKSQRTLCVSFFRMDAGLYIYHLFAWSKLNFLHNSQWITLPTQSCLDLLSFCANLLNSLMGLIVSFLSPDNLHLLFCCDISILVLTSSLRRCSVLLSEEIQFVF